MLTRRRVIVGVVIVIIVLGLFVWPSLGGPMPAFGPWSYVASKNSSKYHDPSCVWADQIRSPRYFWSAEAAEEAGLVPCPICIPEEQ
jgi:methylphosphotriester-DNA--protein-cysteine methyltransferase